MTHLIWICEAPDGSLLTLGEHDHPDGWEGGIFHFAQTQELARRWASDLRAGCIPSNAELDPEPASGESSASQPSRDP